MDEVHFERVLLALDVVLRALEMVAAPEREWLREREGRGRAGERVSERWVGGREGGREGGKSVCVCVCARAFCGCVCARTHALEKEREREGMFVLACVCARVRTCTRICALAARGVGLVGMCADRAERDQWKWACQSFHVGVSSARVSLFILASLPAVMAMLRLPASMYAPHPSSL